MPCRLLLLVVAVVSLAIDVGAEPLRKAETLEQLLRQADPITLARESKLRGDPKRGAILFHRSAAACINCHSVDGLKPALGPSLKFLQDSHAGANRPDEYWIESLIFPSKAVRQGFETTSILTEDGVTIQGIVVEETSDHILLRSPSDLANLTTVAKSSIEARSLSKQSMMPDGLMSALRDEAQFYDLASYILEVATGGSNRINELQPTADELAVKEDWLDLDHSGILKKLKSKDFEAGQAIYHGYCVDCHGADGNHPTVPTARAFGSQKLKFGSDPHKMFMTLSRGNGMMGPMSHLTPAERYQVVHYIREHFMKPHNPDYAAVDQAYLNSLPKGTKDGTTVPSIDRDYGLALASSLERRVRSALTIPIGDFTISYDLHTMNQADIWRGGYLNVDDTHHIRNRGEGNPQLKGQSIAALQGWQWGHDGTLDYSKESVLPRGPLPLKWLDFRGYYIHGNRLIFSYSIDGRSILESIDFDKSSQSLRHRLEIGPGKPLLLGVLKTDSSSETKILKTSSHVQDPAMPPTSATKDDRSTTNNSFISHSIAVKQAGGIHDAMVAVACVHGEAHGCVWHADSKRRIVLEIPQDEHSLAIEVFIGSSDAGMSQSALKELCEFKGRPFVEESLEKQTKGGPVVWPETLRTVGTLGLQRGAYALDTLKIPDSTPWKTWFRTTALDFLSDGRMVVTTYGGDVWLISGIDESLLNLGWKRFASGLYEPMGVKVVDDLIYVTCKDRIVRLHDRDHNDEADFYENFSPDTDVAFHFHSFNFDLQTDSQGNFYYAKGGHGADYSLPGAVIRISADGKQQSIVATGFRAPNGMGILPDGRLTCSDNQGQWTPASKINLLKSDGYYGWVPTYDGKGKWGPDGGKIDVGKVVPPKSFDAPIVWMPQEFDNSSGGQLWVDDPRWGPLSGRLLHTSFGKGWLFYLMMQDLGEVSQASIIKLPFDFRTGIMRARVNPRDGQVYVTGLQGWNGGGRIGLLENGIQRLRYTGQPLRMVQDCRVESNGLRIDFNFALDPKTAADPNSFVADQWNYRRRAEYGSDMYSPKTGQIGIDRVNIESVALSEDRKTVHLFIRDPIPVDQLHLTFKLTAADGTPFEEEVYWTIHRIPK